MECRYRQTTFIVKKVPRAPKLINLGVARADHYRTETVSFRGVSK